MLKFAEQIVLNDEFEMVMNDKAIEILSDLAHPVELSNTKKQLFELMYGIAEHLAVAERMLITVDNAHEDAYTSTSLKENLYVIQTFYEFIDNIEFKRKDSHENN